MKKNKVKTVNFRDSENSPQDKEIGDYQSDQKPAAEGGGSIAQSKSVKESQMSSKLNVSKEAQPSEKTESHSSDQ